MSYNFYNKDEGFNRILGNIFDKSIEPEDSARVAAELMEQDVLRFGDLSTRTCQKVAALLHPRPR